MSSEMETESEGSKEDVVLKNFQTYRIAAYQEFAVHEEKNNNWEHARELYEKALDEINVYRDNISDIQEEATLSKEDQRHLDNMKNDLDNLERNIQQRLDALP